MGYLKQDADTITDFSARILTCAMFQPLNNGQCIFHISVIRLTIDIHDSSDTAGIMFPFVV